jgi:hypothetical protein
MADSAQTFASLALGTIFLGSILFLESSRKTENFGNDETIQTMRSRSTYPQAKTFYSNAQARAAMAQGAANGYVPNVQSNRAYAGPPSNLPQSQSNVNLNASGDQLLAYQLYQQAVNASTPTTQQLESISGQSQEQTGQTSLQGGVSAEYAPYNMLGSAGPEYYSSEYQAVNIGNQRAQQISACAQNAPTFVATSLLPKPEIPNSEAWNIGAPQSILSNQNFLSATQSIGVSTVLGSLRNASHDIRGTIPNPVNIVSPWGNTTILPELERRPLDSFIPSNGLYGSNVTPTGTYVGMSD